MKNIKEITDIFKQEIKKKYTSKIPMPIYMGVSDMEIILEEIERLNKEIEALKQPQVFIDTQDMEERYGEELYKEYLENENKKLHSIIKEVREYIKAYYLLNDNQFNLKNILEILDKEEIE